MIALASLAGNARTHLTARELVDRTTTFAACRCRASKHVNRAVTRPKDQEQLALRDEQLDLDAPVAEAAAVRVLVGDG
jgi:hypothetical protein